MIILLFGPDDYRRLRRRQALVSEFSKRHSALAIGDFDISEDEGRISFREFLRTPSLFTSSRLAVLRDAYADEHADYLADLRLAIARPDITLIVSEGKKPPKKFAFLAAAAEKSEGKAKNKLEEFEASSGAAWRAQVKHECTAQGVTCAPDALALLAEATEGDGWRLATELEKLRSVGKEITKALLADSGVETSPEFWNLVNTLKGSAVGPRLAGLERILATKEPAGKVFNLLAYQLPAGLGAAAALDLAVKRGKLDYEEALLAIALG